MPDRYSLEQPPRVSVVMANHNGAAYVEAAMRSVLNQTLENLELIVVDDGSTDDSITRIKALTATDPRVRLIALAASGGPGEARNRALDAARGDWIAIVDSDDLLHPRRLERLLACAEADGCDVIADDLIHFTCEGPTPPERLFSSARLDGPRSLSLSDLLTERFAGAPNRIGYLKPLIRRGLLGGLRYRGGLRVGEDFDLLLRLAAAGAAITVVPDAYYLYRRHSASVSHRLNSKDARAMVGALRAFQADAGPLPAGVAGDLARRIRRMEARAREAAVLDALRAGRLGAALSAAAWSPDRIPAVTSVLAQAVVTRLRRQAAPDAPLRPLVIEAHGSRPAALPVSWERLMVPRAEAISPDVAAELAAATADRTRTIITLGRLDRDTLGYIPEPERLLSVPPSTGAPPLVHVRTPTFRRPDMLRRALQGLQAQTVSDWVCDVYDDDPERSGQRVVAELADPRIRYHANSPVRRASRNIDFCFTRFNPHGARYFFVLEDDNQVLPRFIEDNIAICETTGARIVLRNQLIEHESGTASACVGTTGLLDSKLAGGFCPPETLHLCIMADMGVSNGGLFWTSDAASDLEVGIPCSSTFQEYLRTVAIVEPVYVALEPLAVWAENGASTGRDLGETADWFRREIDLKRSVQYLQRRVWRRSARDARRAYLDDPAFRYSARMRAKGLVKSLSWPWVGSALHPTETVDLLMRGAAIRVLGRPTAGLARFLSDRRVGRRAAGAELSS